MGMRIFVANSSTTICTKNESAYIRVKNITLILLLQVIMCPVHCVGNTCKHLKLFRMFFSQIFNYRIYIDYNAFPTFHTIIKSIIESN